MFNKVESNPFRWVLSLKHIATVKIIEVLWKHLKSKDRLFVKDKFEECIEQIEKQKVRANYCFSDVIIFMIEMLAIAVDKLPIPQVLKTDLHSILLPMVNGLINWLETMANGDELDSDKIEIIHHFVDNVFWTNIGCVDRPAMYKSYVSSKEIIHFKVWYQLCFYCLEDDIIKFAKTMDWNNCKQCFRSPYSIYWYHKIYGKFPTQSMFDSSYYLSFLQYRNYGSYDDKIILQHFLEHEHNRGLNTGAITYCQRYMQDEEVERLMNAGLYFKCQEVTVYALKTIKERSIMLRCISFNSEILAQLLLWPGVLFIDGWISTLETVDADFFEWIFGNLKWELLKIVGVFYNKILYEPYAKVWRIFYERFSWDDKQICKAFWNIFKTYDYILCRIMFEGMEKCQRKLFLKKLKDEVKKKAPYVNNNNEFLAIFCELVLKDDDERQLFREVSKYVKSANNVTICDCLRWTPVQYNVDGEELMNY